MTKTVAVVPTDVEEANGLLRLALERDDVSVDVLERLVALQEHVSDRNARMAFVSALTAFRDECPQIEKTRENTQFQVTRGGVKKPATYAPLDEIDRIARPIAAKHGLVWTWDTTVDGDLMHVTCKVLHVAGHYETATVSLPHESKAGASPQQKYASTQTYGMRYSLKAALGITESDEDTDGANPREYITATQAADLEALIEEVGADKAKFLRWLKVAHVESLTEDRLPEAIKALEDKRSAT